MHYQEVIVPSHSRSLRDPQGLAGLITSPVVHWRPPYFITSQRSPGGAEVPSSLHNLKVVKSNPRGALVPLDVSPSVPLLG